MSTSTAAPYGLDCDGNPMPRQRTPEAAIRANIGELEKAFKAGKQDEVSLCLDKLAKTHRKYYRHSSEPLVEFRKPSELAKFVPPDGWNLVGDHHIQRGAPFVIAGAPGCGKSRVLTSLAIAGATGAGWMGLKVRSRFRTMIIQCENGPVRLANELRDIVEPDFDEWIRITPPPPLGFAFDDPDFCEQLKDQIAKFEPDIVAVDPWNRVAADDKGRDYKDAFEKLLAILPTGERPPALGISAHTRKPKHDERTSGRGLMNTIAGSYVIASVPRTAFVLQPASDDTEDARVVWTCCKNNDGELGARSAWERQNGLFAPIEDFDWEAFDDRGERKEARRVLSPELIKAILRGNPEGLTKSELVHELVDTHGFGKSAAYNKLKEYAESLTEKDGRLHA